MKNIAIGIVLTLLVGGVYLKSQDKPVVETTVGSAISTAYSFATTTNSGIADPHTLKNRQGVLGRIVLATPSSTGTYACYNATTTDPNKRAAKYSTSTIELVVIEAAPENGFLDIGRTFDVGLVCDEGASFDGIYTVLWD